MSLAGFARSSGHEHKGPVPAPPFVKLGSRWEHVVGDRAVSRLEARSAHGRWTDALCSGEQSRVNAHLISVVIPTHDRADRVLEAAGSVLAQEGPELEVIVVDDGSTDATPEILDALACQDRRVRWLRNPEALGPCEAREPRRGGGQRRLHSHLR